MHPHTQQVWNTALELLRQSVDRKTENTNKKTGNGRDHGFLNGNGQRDRETRWSKFPMKDASDAAPSTAISTSHLLSDLSTSTASTLHSSQQPFLSGEVCCTKKESKKEFKKKTHLLFLKKRKKKGRKPSCLWLLDQTFMLWVICPALWKLAPLCLYCTATSPPGADNSRAPKILAAGVQNETLIFTT